MSTQQVAKIRIAPFNTAEYGEYMDDMTFPRTYYSGAVDNAAGYAAGVSTLVADGDFVGEDPTGYIIYFAGHNAHYRIESTSIAGVLKLNLNLDKPLEKAIVDNEVITICRWYDITDCAVDVQDLEQEIEVNQNELVLEKQIRFRLFNFDNTFYDRTAFTSAWDNVAAYFTTRNTQNAGDNKYVGIWVYNQTTAAYQQFYAGQIVRDEVQINEPQSEIRFMTESVFYGLNDITIKEVDNIFNGHYYNSSYYSSDTTKTQTVSGRYIDIIVKMFHAVGVPKITHDVTSREKNSGQCKIGFVTDPQIIAGEYIEVPTTMGNEYAGLHVCDGAETISGTYYIYYTFGEDTAALDNSDVSGGLTSHRVYFDDYDDFWDLSHESVRYYFNELWFIVQKWRNNEINETQANEILKDICYTFTAFATVRFIEGRVYGLFRAKDNSSPIKLTIGQDDFIGDAEIIGNWRYVSKDGVKINTTANYFDGTSQDESFNYNDELMGVITSVTDDSDNGDYYLEVMDDLNNLGSTDLSDATNRRIAFSNHDSSYLYTADADHITLNQLNKLKSALHDESFVFKEPQQNKTIDYADCFNIKLKKPLLYVTDFNNGKILKYTGVSYGSWTGSQVDTLTEVLGISALQFLPPDVSAGGVIKSNSFGHGFFVTVYDTISASYLYSYGTIGFDRTNKGSIESFSTGGDHVISSNFCYFKHPSTREYGHYLVISFADADKIKLFIISQENQNNYYTDETLSSKIKGTFGIYKFTATEHTHYTLAGPSQLFYSARINGNVLSPYCDEYVYMAWQTITTFRIYKTPLSYSTSLDAGAIGTETPTSGPSLLDLHLDYIYYTLGALTGNDVIRKVQSGQNLSTAVDVVGGGATEPAAAGSSVSGLSNVLFDGLRSFWISYNGDIYFANQGTTDYSVGVCDVVGDVVYTIDRSDTSAVLVEASRITGLDFINTYKPIDGEDYLMSISYATSKKHFEYYSKDRRIIKGSLDWNNIGNIDLGIGDRIAVQDDVVANDTYSETIFWISKLSFNFETQQYDLELLEDTDAEQGIGAMIIGQDNEVA